MSRQEPALDILHASPKKLSKGGVHKISHAVSPCEISQGVREVRTPCEKSQG